MDGAGKQLSDAKVRQGLKRWSRLRESLQFRLSLSLSLVILAVALIAGIFSFITAYDEAMELQDDTLRRIAEVVDPPCAPFADGGAAGGRNGRRQDESRLVIQCLGTASAGRDPAEQENILPLPANLPDGLQTMQVGGESFRVLVRTRSDGRHLAVAQETAFRDEIARDGALRAVMPLLLLVPILLIVVAHLVRKMFRPIAVLARDVGRRDERSLHPVPNKHVPGEMQPFITAINDLLSKVGLSMDRQQRFIADAAHELRTPLTALSLQGERLADAEMSGSARARLATLRQGIARSQGLLEKLLALARAQSAVDATPSATAVGPVLRRVVEDLMPLALAKNIDLGVVAMPDAATGQGIAVRASELDLITLLRNLVDNAIRYTPAGGAVDLALATFAENVVLQVRDSGPGIPPSERERVFDAFYRTLDGEQVGSGLGLTIVKAIAERIGATIGLDYSRPEDSSGLLVTVTIPDKTIVAQARR